MANEGKQQGYKPEYQPSPQKGNQRTTAVVLSIVTCLFMCALGYEIIQLNQQKASGTPPAPIGARNSGSEPVRRTAYREPIASNYDDDDEYMNYELKALREQNRRQASKIKSLKQEIVNRLQEQHDLKATLFKQEGDPRDKARIAELNNQLAQKEMVTMQLQHQLKELETEKQQFEKKMLHAEVTKEALTNMLEQQRSVRDQEISKLKSQISSLEKQREIENLSATSRLLQYEDTQQRLKESVEESGYAAFYLESEINHLKEALVNSQQQRKEIENNLLEQLYNTVASLELTEVETATLKNKLRNAYVRHNRSLKENNQKISRLEREIAEHRKHLKEKNALFDSIHDVYSVALIQTKTEIDDVGNLYEEEKEKSQTLENELAKEREVLQSLQKNYRTLKKDRKQALEVERKLDESNEKIAFLQAELDVHKFSLAEREKHLDQLHQGKLALESKYQEKIQELSASLHHEQANKSTMELQIEYLSGKLELENARHQSTRSALDELSATLRDLESQVQHTAQTEDELKKSNIRAAALQKELERQQELLSSKERQIGSNLQKEQDAIARLEKELEANKDAVYDKQMQLLAIEQSKKDLEQQLHTHIASLTKDLEQERSYIASLEKQLSDTQNELRNEKAAHESTKSVYTDLNTTKKTLEEQNRYNATLQKSLEENKQKLAELEAELDIRQGVLETKDYHLQSTVMKQSQVVSRLEQELARHKSELEEKHETLNLTSAEQKKLEQDLTNRIAALTQELAQERKQHDNILASVERELGVEKAQVETLKKQIGTLQDQVEKEKSSYATLRETLEESRLALLDQNALKDSLNDQHRYSARLEKSLGESVARADMLQRSIDDLTAQLQANDQRYQSLFKEEERKIAALLQEQQGAQNLIIAREYEIQKLKEELNLQVSLTESYDQRVKELQNQESERVSQLKTQINSYVALVDTKEEMLREYKQREEEIHHNLMSEIAQLTNNVEKEAQQSRNLREQMRQVEERYVAEQDHSRQIQQQLERSEHTVATLESELRQFQTERSHTSERIAELEAQVNDLLRSTRAKETADAKRFDRFNHR
jgi:epidermal growth factor receptor substrate 15